MKHWKTGLSVLLGIGVFLFWYVGFPHALSYQEQYQLFLWTADYFCQRMSVAGGLADYLGEFVVQFYYIPWLGALLLALLFVLLQRLSGRTLLSFVPPLLLLCAMGDVSVLLSYMMALLMVLAAARIRLPWWVEVVAVPALYWLAGSMAWLYTALRVVQRGWRWLWLPLWLLATVLLAYAVVLKQWPLQMVLWTMTYYRVPLQMPTLLFLIPVAVVLVVVLDRLPWLSRRPRLALVIGLLAVMAAAVSVPSGYDKDVYELIRQDYFIRQERWDALIERSERYEVRTPFWSNSVNLALSQRHQLAERMFDFYQSGEDALIMPRTRDLTSNLPSAEAFWRLGLVNSAQRYMFDIQESILNGKKSGRCTQRIAECMIVNGHYQTAAKHLRLLKQSLFYRQWAVEAEQYLYQEQRIAAHPVWGRLRQLRFKDDFLFSYTEIDKVFGLLFMDNHDNKMALDYFLGELLLKGNVQGVMQYMPWAEQYGGYRYMPTGYQDAVQCIQKQGQLPGSRYGSYVQRMMNYSQKDHE